MEYKSNYRLKLIASTVSACFLVSGCSFDKDEDSDESVNLAPSVAISGQGEIQEKRLINLYRLIQCIDNFLSKCFS